jgi:hypothetical protein
MSGDCMKKFVFMIAMSVMFCLPGAYASDTQPSNGFLFFTLGGKRDYPDATKLKETRNDVRVYQGYRSQYTPDLITVRMRTEDFEKEYDFCALAGVTSDGSVHCRFGQTAFDGYIFESNNGAVCYFVCKQKQTISKKNK